MVFHNEMANTAACSLSGFIFTYLFWSQVEEGGDNHLQAALPWDGIGGRIDNGDHTAFHCLHQDILGDAWTLGTWVRIPALPPTGCVTGMRQAPQL